MGDVSSPGLLSKSASAYEHLKRMAVRGLLRPNRRLSPADLADHFQVSITPVRDALVRLAAEEFIRSEVGRGYFTKPWVEAEQRDLHQLISILYVSSLQALGPQAAAQVEARTMALRRDEAADPGAAAAASEQVYVDLAAAMGNGAVVASLRNALERSHLIRGVLLQRPESRSALADDLDHIAKAVAAGELLRAIEIARRQQDVLAPSIAAAVSRANLETSKLRFP